MNFQEAMAEANRKRIGTAFKAMSHGNKDFNTCNEYKDGGLAPDDPFHKIKTEKFGVPFAPSSPAKSVHMTAVACCAVLCLKCSPHRVQNIYSDVCVGCAASTT